jgi:hypothetical protein
MKTILISLLLVLLGCASKALADEASYYKMKVDTEALFHMQGDLVDVKIAVDKIVDPSIDAEALRRKFNEDSAPLTLMMQGVGPDHEKLKILRRFLFEAGNWNQNRVLSYDFADPFAKISNHRFLT